MQTTIRIFQRTSIVNVLILCLFCLALFLVSGCGGGSSALVGRWELEKSDGPSVNSLDFFKDGTGAADNISLTWTTDGNRLKITRFGHVDIEDYKISGSTLTLTTNSGRKSTFKKKK
jgi:hypothetical protein